MFILAGMFDFDHLIYSDSLSTFLIIFVVSLFFFLFFLFFSNSKPPTKTSCPQCHPIIGNLLGLLRNLHRFHDWVTDLLSQTPSSTLQVNTFLNLSHIVCTVNPANIRHLLLSNFPNYIKGSRFHDVVDDLLGQGIFNVDGDSWTFQRKIASHEFSTNSLKHFISEVVRSEISERLIPLLNGACDENRVIDLQTVLQDFTFNNICNVAFGVDPDIIKISGFVKAFDDAVEISLLRFLSPVSVIWKAKRFLGIGSEKRFKEAIEIINDFALEIIKSKEREDGENSDKSMVKNQDLLSRFMSSTTLDEELSQDKEQRWKFLRDIVISFILAGKDTTSTALTWFFWLMAGNPRCASRVREELSSLPASENQQRRFGYDELKKLNYLHAALSESMRLFPPVPINSRLTVQDDVLPDGTHVGKGWFADYSAYAMGRTEKVWGPDCTEYNPKRWLDEEGCFRPSDPFRYPVFHCGPRMCLGKEMAYVQMKSVAAAVMKEFEIVAVDGGGSAERMRRPPYAMSLVLKMKGGFPVRIRRRNLG